MRLAAFEDSLLADPAKKIKYDRNEDDRIIIARKDGYAREAAWFAELETIGLSYKNDNSITKEYFTFRSTKLMIMAALDI